MQGRPTRRSSGGCARSPRLLRLEPYLERTPLALSGGQQQRTAIARALVKGADLVLLDEPLANLDYKLREELRAELPRIFEVSGAIFVYATTEPSEALLLGGRTICLSEGRVLQVGDTPSVYRRPDSLRVAELFSDPPLNTVRDREEGRRRGLWRRRHGAGQRPLCRAGATGRTASVSAPTSLPWPSGRGRPSCLPGDGGAHRDHRLGKLRPSRARRQRTGSPSLPGVHEFPPGQALEAALDPDDLFVFDPDGRLVAAPAAGVRARAMARIDLVDLAHSYGGADADPASFALKPTSMTWRQGGAYALLGPSGCGKTTLLNIISGIVRPIARQGAVRRQGRHGARRPSSATSPRCSSSR